MEAYAQCCSMLGILSYKFAIGSQVFLLIDTFPLHLAFIARLYKNPFDLEFLVRIELGLFVKWISYGNHRWMMLM